MKIVKALLVFWMIIIASLAYASEELVWTPVKIPGLEIDKGTVATMNIGIWFHGDFGWLNTDRQLWITHNAGRNWELSLTSLDGGRPFYDSHFINSLAGWVVAWPNSLFHTKDGGASWWKMEIELADASGELIEAGLTRIYFKDLLHGLGIFGIVDPGITGSGWKGGIIAHTNDGGQHWTELSSGPVLPRMTGFGDQVWIVSQIGKAYYTSDFGETFLQISIPTLNSTHLVFASSLYGWLAVDNFNVLKTTDGGNTWSGPIFTRVGKEFWSGIKSLYSVSEELGLILWYSSLEQVDGPSLLYTTYNGGESWFSSHVPDGNEFIAGFNRWYWEVWLIPIGSKLDRIFHAPIDTTTSIQPSNKLFTTWALLKKARKEH